MRSKKGWYLPNVYDNHQAGKTVLLSVPVLLFLSKRDSFKGLWLSLHVICRSKKKLWGKQTGVIVLLLANIIVLSGCLRATRITPHNTLHPSGHQGPPPPPATKNTQLDVRLGEMMFAIFLEHFSLKRR